MYVVCNVTYYVLVEYSDLIRNIYIVKHSKIEFPDKYIRMVRLLHDNMSASVLIDSESTESFKDWSQAGMCHSHNTPLDFHLYRRIEGKLFNLRRLKAITSHMTTLQLQYADDNALVTHTEDDLQSAVNVFSQ